MARVDEFFSKLWYGAVAPSAGISDDMQRWGLTLLWIIGADGISEAEMKFLGEIARHMGAPPEMVAQVMHIDPKSINVREVLAGFTHSLPARAMLHDAIRIASVDGYSDEERKAVREAARLLGVEESVLAQIEALIEADAACARARMALLFPDGKFA